MKAIDCLQEARTKGPSYQQPINEFIDAFRRAPLGERQEMVRDPITVSGPIEGLIAAVVSALCREVGMEAPGWVAEIHSPEPFFAFPAGSYALRVRLLLESPAPFRVRNVFVPENYLSRA